jgi:hypothetical protein
LGRTRRDGETGCPPPACRRGLCHLAAPRAWSPQAPDRRADYRGANRRRRCTRRKAGSAIRHGPEVTARERNAAHHESSLSTAPAHARSRRRNSPCAPGPERSCRIALVAAECFSRVQMRTSVRFEWNDVPAAVNTTYDNLPLRLPTLSSLHQRSVARGRVACTKPGRNVPAFSVVN